MVLNHERKTLGHAVVFLLVMLVSPAISKDSGILTRMLYADFLAEQGVAVCMVADPAFASEVSGLSARRGRKLRLPESEGGAERSSSHSCGRLLIRMTTTTPRSISYSKKQRIIDKQRATRRRSALAHESRAGLPQREHAVVNVARPDTSPETIILEFMDSSQPYFAHLPPDRERSTRSLANRT
jgi:hypothetical protein